MSTTLNNKIRRLNLQNYQIVKNFYFKFRFKAFSTISSSDNQEDSSKESNNSENFFIKDNTEIFPIKQKVAYLIAENEEFQEFNRIVGIIKTISNEFELEKFKVVLNYISDYTHKDVFLLKWVESIFINNLNLIDYVTKSNCVVILGEHVCRKRIPFKEESWLIIMKDFTELFVHISFQEYYNYVNTFDQLFIKRKVQEGGEKYSKEFDHFMSVQNINLFNTGKIQFKSLDDLVLFSKLIHNQILKIGNVSDNIWLNINKFIEESAFEMNFYKVLITSIFINYVENTAKVHIISGAIDEINKFIFSLLKNFFLLDHQEQEKIINSSDIIFTYYISFMSQQDKKNVLTNSDIFNSNYFLLLLIRLYTEKLKRKNDEFMIVKEYRILQFLAKEVKYNDKEFWDIIAEKTLEHINHDLMKIINEIFPARLLKGSSMSEEKIRYQEKCEMKILIYSGLIVDIFSSIDYTEQKFWEITFQKIQHFANFKIKDSSLILNFIALGCRQLFKKESFSTIWEMFTNLLDNNNKYLFRNREICDFLVKVVYPLKNINSDNDTNKKNSSISTKELNKCLNILFVKELNSNNDISTIKLFVCFFNLIKSKISEDNVLKILSGILVDLVKMNQDNKQFDFDVKIFYKNLDQAIAEKMNGFIKERIINLINDSEMENEIIIKSFYYLIRKMINGEFLDELDTVRMRFKLESESRLTDNKKILFERLLKDF